MSTQMRWLKYKTNERILCDRCDVDDKAVGPVLITLE